MPGINIGGRPHSNLRYADDTTLIANSKKDLTTLIQQVKNESEAAVLMINVKKAKVMTSEDIQKFEVGAEAIDVVEFSFLGASINRDEDCGKEIRRRMAIGKASMEKLVKAMKDKDVPRRLKIELAQTVVFPVVTYWSES